MPIRQPQFPVRFTPSGLVDAYDASLMFPGACRRLDNLIFDESNPELMVARPGVTPIVAAAASWLDLPGTSGNYASTPDSAAVSITGDIEISVKLAMVDWTPVAAARPISKRTYLLRVNADGTLSFLWSSSADVTGDFAAHSTVATGLIDGSTKWLHVTLDVNNGAGGRDIKFYVSDDGVNRTQLGATITQAGVTSIFDGVAPLELGSGDGGLTDPLNGRIDYAEVRNGIDGPVVASFDAADAQPGDTSITSFATGEIWTINQSGSPNAFLSGAIDNAGVISVHITVGHRTYGMIDSDLNPGTDQPFCYDHDDAAFVAISGITAGNSPTTQSVAGSWNPPTMAVIGTYIIVTHPGFAGGATKFGVIDITTAATPAWSATDTATNALSAVPTAVANYRNRAWFVIGNILAYTDVLDPLTRTNASQSLTIGDTAEILALSGLPIQTTSAGIVAALLAFKETQVWQITGDAATSDLIFNFLSLSVGCPAPRTVTPAPLGVYFASNGGPYIVDGLGLVKPVLNNPQRNEPDLHASYERMVEPTRAAAAYANNVYRVCMETVRFGTQDDFDFWFYEHRRRWCGPHTFEYHCAQPLEGNFVLSSDDRPGELFLSRPAHAGASIFTDDGNSYECLLRSATFPKTGRMTEKLSVESTIELTGGASAATYNMTALNDNDTTLGIASVQVTPSGGLWGSFVWNDGTLWSAGENVPNVYDVPWTDALQFKKLAIQVHGTAGAGFGVGTFFTRYQECGYVGKTTLP